MPAPASFRSSDVDGQQINVIMREYLARERAGIYRRLLIVRCGLLATVVGVAGFGFRWLPPFASWFSVGLCLVAPVWAGIYEIRCDRRLARHLHRVQPPDGPNRKKVVKSS